MNRPVLALCPVLILCCVGLIAGPINVPGIVPNHTLNGAELAGLKVTVVWDFGPMGSSPGLNSFTYTWVATGPDSGGIPAPFPFPVPIMSLTGNSATAMWMFNGLYADPVVTVILDGTDVGILFDRALPSPGTPGTGTGNDASSFPAFVTYGNPVGVGGLPPVGDLYSQLRFDLPPGALLGVGPFLQTTVAATPEPATAMMFVAGLGLLLLRVKRNA